MTTTISSVKDLDRCLKENDLPVKLEVLQKMYLEIGKAGNRARKLNPELLDLLFEHYLTSGENSVRTLCACILLISNDKRKYQVAEKEFISTTENAVLLLCADILTALPKSERVRIFSPVVRNRHSAVRHRLSANLLSDTMELLPPDVALRVSILSDHGMKKVHITEETLSSWIGELTGPYRMNARKMVSEKGEVPFEILFKNRSRLPSDLFIWLLNEMDKKGLPSLKNMLMQVLQEGAATIVLKHVLHLLSRIPLTEKDEPVLSMYYHHEDVYLRASALSIGPARLPWEAWFSDGMPDEIRAALLKRMTRNRNKTGLIVLDRLLEDGNWKIRARATEALTALAPESLVILESRLKGDHPEAKICAAQALKRLGKEKKILQVITGTEKTSLAERK